MPTPNKYDRWRDLLAGNHIPQVLEELQQVFSQSTRLNEIIHQRGRHAALSERIRKGDIDLEDETVLENEIRLGVLALLDDVEKWERTETGLAEQLATVTINGNAINSIINSTVTAEQVHIGDIHYHGEAIPHFLTAAPQNPPVFKGRKKQLKDLHDQLFNSEGDHLILLVNGQGGVGKTSMANRYFFDYHHEYSHAAWALKEGSIRDAMLTLEFGLNLKFTTENNEQRLNIILQKVANLKAPCLLIIDNANERDDLVKHIGELRKCANFHVLLTSRLDRFDGAETFKVGALPELVAKELFEKYYRPFKEEETGLFSDVYHAVDGNTLVLQLLAKNLKRNRREYNLSQLLEDLQKRGVLRLSKSRKVVTDYGTLDEGEIEEIVAAMYDFGDLNDDHLKLLSVFAALPPEQIPFEHLELLVTFLDDLDETLDALQELGWVEESEEAGESSYRCSPVVQAVVRAKNNKWREVLSMLRSNIEDHLETDEAENLKIGIEAARPFVVYGEAIRPNLPQIYANSYFLQQLTAYYTTSGDLRSAYELSEERNTLLKELLEAEPDNAEIKNSLAISYEKLGSTHSSLGNLSKALEFFEQYNTLKKELHGAYPANVGFKNGLAISYVKLGEVAQSPDRKRTEYQKAEQLWIELTEAFPDYAQFQQFLGIIRERLEEL